MWGFAEVLDGVSRCFVSILLFYGIQTELAKLQHLEQSVIRRLTAALIKCMHPELPLVVPWSSADLDKNAQAVTRKATKPFLCLRGAYARLLVYGGTDSSCGQIAFF